MTIATGILRRAARPRQRSAWIPWAFAGGLAIVAVVNGALTYFALHSAPGTVSDRPYEEGLDYDRILARAAAQDALGWRSEMTVAAETAGPGTVVQIRLADRSGAPLTGATVAVRLARPVGPADAVALTPTERAPGVYATVVDAGAGQWDLHLLARRGADSYAATRRVIVK